MKEIKDKYLQFRKLVETEKGELKSLGPIFADAYRRNEFLLKARPFLTRDPDQVLFKQTGAPILAKAELEVYDQLSKILKFNVPYRSRKTYQIEHIESLDSQHTKFLYKDLKDWCADIFATKNSEKGIFDHFSKLPFDIKICDVPVPTKDVGLMLRAIQGQNKFMFPTPYDDFVDEAKQNENGKHRSILMIPTKIDGFQLPHFVNTVAIFNHRKNEISGVVFIDSVSEVNLRATRKRIVDDLKSGVFEQKDFNVSGITLSYQGDRNGCRVHTASNIAATCEALITKPGFIKCLKEVSKAQNSHQVEPFKETLKLCFESAFLMDIEGNRHTSLDFVAQEMYKIKWALGNRELDKFYSQIDTSKEVTHLNTR